MARGWLTFDQLRRLESSGPYCTGQLFQALKKKSQKFTKRDHALYTHFLAKTG